VLPLIGPPWTPGSAMPPTARRAIDVIPVMMAGARVSSPTGTNSRYAGRASQRAVSPRRTALPSSPVRSMTSAGLTWPTVGSSKRVTSATRIGSSLLIQVSSTTTSSLRIRRAALRRRRKPMIIDRGCHASRSHFWLTEADPEVREMPAAGPR
jgi:hypothetical protein